MSLQENESGHSTLTNNVNYSYAIAKGNVRKTNEDRWSVEEFKLNGKLYQVILVADGHAGHEVAELIKKTFVITLKQKLEANDVRAALEKTFVQLNEDSKTLDSGSTLSVILIVNAESGNRKVFVSNAGDSCVYGVKGTGDEAKIRKISLDHHVTVKKELKRVQDSENHYVEGGYVVTKAGNDMLAMTRAIGDLTFGDVITPKPMTKKLQCNYSAYCIGSDGIFDVMSGKQVWKLVAENADWKTAAKHVLDHRMKNHEQHDNSTIIIVMVNDNIDKTTS